MSDLTYDAPTTVDARGALGHPEHPWADDDEETVLPDMILPRAFSVSGNPLFYDLDMRLIERCNDVDQPDRSDMVLP